MFAFAFVTSGIVYYESWHTRHKGSSQPRATVVSPPPKVSPPPVSLVAPPLEVASEQVTPPAASAAVISPSGWGRNPFLTAEEWAKLHEPVKAPEPIKAPEVVAELPRYVLTGIIQDPRGKWYALLESGKRINVGDRLGVETVKEIRGENRSVILENAGKTRELSLPKG